MTSNHIELNRDFVVVHYDWPRDKESAQRNDLDDSELTGKALTLEQLLDHKVAVILGEPGSGKSEELRSLHRKHGGFFIRLERLVDEALPEILSDEDRLTFDSWKMGEAEALFLLDAVDEAKLEHDEDFAKAVDRVSKQIGAALPRARFVITSRISEWRAQTDLDITRALVAPVRRQVADKMPRDGETFNLDDAAEGHPVIIVAAIQPLTPVQVQRFAEGRGVPEAARFLSALRDRNALMFAVRPLDVILLYEYWHEKGDLSGLTGLVRYMVEKLLTEVRSKEKHDPLSRSQAREGAEYLAAVYKVILQSTIEFIRHVWTTLYEIAYLQSTCGTVYCNFCTKKVILRNVFQINVNLMAVCVGRRTFAFSSITRTTNPGQCKPLVGFESQADATSRTSELSLLACCR